MLDRSGTRVIRSGTPVLLAGTYDFHAPPPWRSPEWLAQTLRLPLFSGEPGQLPGRTIEEAIGPRELGDWGMPEAALRTGAVDVVLPLDAIGSAIDAIVHGRPIAGAVEST